MVENAVIWWSDDLVIWWPGRDLQRTSGTGHKRAAPVYFAFLGGVIRRWAGLSNWTGRTGWAGYLLYWLRQPIQLYLTAVKAADTTRFAGEQGRSYPPPKEVGAEVQAPTMPNRLRAGIRCRGPTVWRWGGGGVARW